MPRLHPYGELTIGWHADPEDWRQSFDTPAGRNGISSYQPLYHLIHAHRQRAGPVKPLPIVIGETGWQGTNQTLKAQSFVAALQQVFFRDPHVVAVLPFLLADFGPYAKMWPWVQWKPGDTKPYLREREWLSTKALRCSQNVGGRAGC